METSIAQFHEKFYILAIQNLVFHFSRAYILGTHKCGKELCQMLQRRGYFRDVKCYCDNMNIMATI